VQVEVQKIVLGSWQSFALTFFQRWETLEGKFPEEKLHVRGT
jgi:hypothetical protein